MERNKHCKSSCPTQDHTNEADCWRENMPMFVGVSPSKHGWDQTKVKKDERELASYYGAIRQGIEPRSTQQKDIDAAVKLSNDAGKAFDGTTLKFKD
jgi:hypothetical protein